MRGAAYSSNLFDPFFAVQLVLVHAKNALTPFNPPPIVMLCRLLAFVVVLALANLGTSFASAVLAKDTTTSNGQLVDKKTNEAVATATAVETYTMQEDDVENARRLAECDKTNIVTDCNATVSSPTTMSNTSALAMLKSCLQNKNVQLQLTSSDNNIVTTTTVCAPGWCSGSSYTMDEDNIKIPVAGELCIQDSTEKLHVKQTPDDSATYTLSHDLFAMTRKPTASPTTRKPTTCVAYDQTWIKVRMVLE